MENRDFLRLLTSRLDNSALRVLSLTPFWSEIKNFTEDQYWWHLRVQHLLGVTLKQRPGANWKSIYSLLLTSVNKEDYDFTEEVLSSPLAVSIMLEAGADPSEDDNYAIQTASGMGYTEVVKLLLADPRVDPTSEDIDQNCLMISLENGHLEIVKLLLADDRIDPTVDDNYAIKYASEHGYTEIVKLLLTHPEVDPGVDNSYPIIAASSSGHADIVKLLLADERVDPDLEDNEAIRMASDNGHLEVVKLLLADPRVDPSAEDNYALNRSSWSGHTEIVKLLLLDPRVDPSYATSNAIYSHLDILELLLNDKRTILEDGGSNMLYDAYRLDNIPLLATIVQGRAVDLQAVSTEIMRYILAEVVPTYSRDSLDGCIALSRGRAKKDSDILNLLVSNKYENSYYYIFLRELLLKKLELKYYFSWLVEQCERHADVVDYRMQIAEAAKSYPETGRVIHTSALFTAYSGFLLLAKSSNAQAILNLLSREEGVTEQGLQLAGMLIGAYLGLKRIA